MRRSLDELIDFLLEEIALSGRQGTTLSQIKSSVCDFYHEADKVDESIDTENAITKASVFQNVDQSFLERIWQWLSRHPDVSIGSEKQYNKLSLRDVEAQWPGYATGSADSEGDNINQPFNIAETTIVNSDDGPGELEPHQLEVGEQNELSVMPKRDAPRIFVTESRMYEALCGHAWDPKRIFPLEFALLSYIAAARGEGILQGDLVRASGQDKRSVPQRTDTLSKKGYIVKSTVYVRGTKTSRLTLQKFSKDAVSRPGPAKSSLKSLIPPRTIGSVVTQLFDLLAQKSLVSQNELVEELTLRDNGFDRVLSKVLKRLASLGHIKRVKTSLAPSASRADMENFIQLVQRPKQEQLTSLNTDGFTLDSSIDDVASSLAPVNSPNAQEAELVVTGASSSRTLPCWNPDRVLANTCQQAVLSSQGEAFTNIAARSVISGPLVRRTLESLLTRLSHRSLLAQPSYLRHLAIVRHAETTDSTKTWYFYPATSLQTLVEMKQLEIKSIPGLRAYLKDITENTNEGDDSVLRPPESEQGDDSFGFVGRTKPSHQVQNGEASITDIIKSLGVLDKALSAREPRIVELPDSTLTLVVSTAAAEDGDEDEEEEEEAQQFERDATMTLTPAQTPIRPYRKKSLATATTQGRVRREPSMSIHDDSDDDGKDHSENKLKKVKGRPRKFLPGTEEFWRRQLLEAKQHAEPNATRSASEVGLMSDPLGLNLFKRRPKDFDETLIRAMNANLPLPSKPHEIKQNWVNMTKTILDRKAPGLYISPAGTATTGPGCKAQTMILRSSRLSEIDFTDRSVVATACFSSSMAAHTRHYRRFYPNLPRKRVARTHQTRQSATKDDMQLRVSVAPGVVDAYSRPPAGRGPKVGLFFEETPPHTRALHGKENVPPPCAFTPQQLLDALVVDTTDDEQRQVATPHSASRRTASDSNAPRRQSRATSIRQAGGAVAGADTLNNILKENAKDQSKTRVVPTTGPRRRGRPPKRAKLSGIPDHLEPQMIDTNELDFPVPGLPEAAELGRQAPALPIEKSVGQHATGSPSNNTVLHAGVHNMNVLSQVQDTGTNVADDALAHSQQHALVETMVKEALKTAVQTQNELHSHSDMAMQTAQQPDNIDAAKSPDELPPLPRMTESQAEKATNSVDKVTSAERRAVSSASLESNEVPHSLEVAPIVTAEDQAFASVASEVSDESYEDEDELDARPSKRRKVDKQGVGRYGIYNREIGWLLQRIIVDLVEACDGALPGLANTLRRGMLNRWRGTGRTDNPTAKRVKAAIKALCDKGRLRQHHFAFRGKSGLMKKDSVISLPSMPGDHPLVTDLKLKIQEAEPTEYTPPKLEAESHRTGHIPIRSPSPSQRPGPQSKVTPSKATRLARTEPDVVHLAGVDDKPDDAPSSTTAQVVVPVKRRPGRPRKNSVVQAKAIPASRGRTRNTSVVSTSTIDGGQVAGTVGAFITLRIPRLATLQVVQEAANFRAAYLPPVEGPLNFRGLNSPTVVFKFNPDIGHAEATIPTPKQLRKSGFRPKPGGRLVPLPRQKALRRRIVWKQSTRKVLPDSLATILKAQPGSSDTQHPLLEATPLKQFELEIDKVEAWETSTVGLFDEPRSEWIFINHIPDLPEDSWEQPNIIKFRDLENFNTQLEHFSKPLPPTESWAPFIQALDTAHKSLAAASPVSLTPEPKSVTTRSGRKVKKRTTTDAQLDDNVDHVPKRPNTGRTRIRNKDNINVPRSERRYAFNDAGVLLDTSRPHCPKPVKMFRGRQVLRNVPEQEVYRLAVTMVVIRTLAGGVDKMVDWKLVRRFFPNQDEELTQQQWRSLSNRYRAEIFVLTDNFQDRYIDALENDEVPVVNFNNLQQTDWKGIVEWAVANLDKFGTRDTRPLPKTKSLLRTTVDMAFDDQGKHLRDLHAYSINVSKTKLEETVSGTIFGTEIPRTSTTLQLDTEDSIVDDLLVSELDEKDDALAKAKSWVMATVLTPRQRFDPVVAQQKLLELAATTQQCNELLDRALKALVRDKLICQASKDDRFDFGGMKSGRKGPKGWEPAAKYYEQFEWRRYVTSSMLKKARIYKTDVLDVAFRVGNDVAISKDVVMDDAEMVCITNLLSIGAIKIRMGNDVPKSKYGLGWQDHGYQTRLMDKSLLGFTVHLEMVPDKYVFEDHDTNIAPEVIPKGDMDSNGKIPSWFDIHGNFQQELWESMLAAVIGLVDMRPGVSTAELSRCVSSCLTKWEIELMVEWLLKGGFVCRSGYDGINDDFDALYEGWETTETWWLVLGVEWLV